MRANGFRRRGFQAALHGSQEVERLEEQTLLFLQRSSPLLCGERAAARGPDTARPEASSAGASNSASAIAPGAPCERYAARAPAANGGPAAGAGAGRHNHDWRCESAGAAAVRRRRPDIEVGGSSD